MCKRGEAPVRQQKPNQRKKRWSGFCGGGPSLFLTSATLFVPRLVALNIVIEVLRLKDPGAKKFPQGTNIASMLVCPFGCPVIVVVANWLASVLANCQRQYMAVPPPSGFSICLFCFRFLVSTFSVALFLMTPLTRRQLARMQAFGQGVFDFLFHRSQGKPKFLPPRTPLSPWQTKTRRGEGLISGGENHLFYLAKNRT